MFKNLDPILHNQLRLSIMSILISVDSAEFSYLLEKTSATRGNLSVQINKLKDAGKIDDGKSYRNNYPLTTCKISQEGISAFEKYVDAISGYLKK